MRGGLFVIVIYSYLLLPNSLVRNLWRSNGKLPSGAATPPDRHRGGPRIRSPPTQCPADTALRTFDFPFVFLIVFLVIRRAVSVRRCGEAAAMVGTIYSSRLKRAEPPTRSKAFSRVAVMTKLQSVSRCTGLRVDSLSRRIVRIVLWYVKVHIWPLTGFLRK